MSQMFEIHLKLDTKTIEHLKELKIYIEAETIEETILRILEAWRIMNPIQKGDIT